MNIKLLDIGKKQDETIVTYRFEFIQPFQEKASYTDDILNEMKNNNSVYISGIKTSGSFTQQNCEA